MLADKDRIFTNLYGFQDWGLDAARKRGSWDGTKAILERGPETIVDQYGTSRENRMFWQSPVLPRGTHVLRARATGDQNPSSRYIWVTLEHIEIDN